MNTTNNFRTVAYRNQPKGLGNRGKTAPALRDFYGRSDSDGLPYAMEIRKAMGEEYSDIKPNDMRRILPFDNHKSISDVDVVDWKKQ